MKITSLVYGALIATCLTGTVPANAQTPDGVTHVDKAPKPIQEAHPYYPFELRAQRIQGHALVEFLVDTKGEVVEARVVEATNEAFGASAVACVSKWKFEPGTRDGHPAIMKLRVPIDYALQ
jgi:periplasmic protein TonB